MGRQSAGARGQGSGARDEKPEAPATPANPQPAADPGPEQTPGEVNAPIEEQPTPADPQSVDIRAYSDRVESLLAEGQSYERAIEEALLEGATSDAAPAAASGVKRVEVLFSGRLGPKLLTRGDITDDPAYVALLNDRRNLVREVKEDE